MTRSPAPLWVIGMLLVAVGGGVTAFGASSTSVGAIEPPSYVNSDEGNQSGRLDDLAASCENGNLGDCDLLYYESPVGSYLESVGASCGGQVANPVPGMCVAARSEGSGTSALPTRSIFPSPPAAPSPSRDGDLGIPGEAISSPACDGGFALFVGSAVTLGRYHDDVADFLSLNPGASYMRNRCLSLRRETSDGNPIYAVYYGPFPSLQEALANCSRSAATDAFVKPLDDVSDPTDYTFCFPR